MRTFSRACLLLTGIVAFGLAHADGFDAQRRAAFVDTMAARDGFERATLQALLDKAEYRQDIIDAITRPAEALPWHRYRPIFVTEQRIQGGVEFWNEHAALLERVSEQSGVAPEILVAIVGVETYYGRHKGRHRVIDALSTLAFAYPKRAEFFASELEHYLLLAREEGFDPLEPIGSYAGAMGMPQFIASSYRHYAVDGDGDGRRNLFDNPADVLASVANYFRRHGWRNGEPVAYPAKTRGDGWKTLIEKNLEPQHQFKQLLQAGVTVEPEVDPDRISRLLALELANGEEHWATFHNFYVITRYNHSPLYAMAVYQLSQAIKSAREAG